MKQPVLLPLLFVLMLPLWSPTLHVSNNREQSSGQYVVSVSQTPYLVSPIWQEQERRPPRKDYNSTHYLATQSQCHPTHHRHVMEKRSEWSRVSLPQASENYLWEKRSSLSHSHETTKWDHTCVYMSYVLRRTMDGFRLHNVSNRLFRRADKGAHSACLEKLLKAEGWNNCSHKNE